MPIQVVPVSQAEAAGTLPEPEISFEVDPAESTIRMIAEFKGVNPDEVFKRSKQTLYFSRTAKAVPVTFEVNGVEQALSLDSLGRQPLQVKVSLSAPFLEEKEASNGTGEAATGEAADEDEDV